MSEISIKFKASALIPMIEVYRDYFGAKYPCTDESNDGSNMPVEDKIKYGIYDYLLECYQNRKDYYESEYNKFKEKMREGLL